MPRIDLIQFRGGTAAEWTTANPILDLKEPGYETDTGRIKIGDGASAWNALPYRFETAPGADGVIQYANTTAFPATGATNIIYIAADTDSLYRWNGSGYSSVGGGGGGGATNLSATPAPTSVVITSDTGTDATLLAADGTNAGLLLPAEKAKLASLSTNETYEFTLVTFDATTTLDLLTLAQPKHKIVATTNNTNLEITNHKSGEYKGRLKITFSGIVALTLALDSDYTHRQAGEETITSKTLNFSNGSTIYVDYEGNGTTIDWFFPEIAELAQDAVGSILDDGTVGDINLNYNDLTPKISGTIKSKSVTYAKIAGTTGTTERVLSTTAVGDIQSTTEIQPYKRDDLLTILDGATWAGDTYTVTGQTPNNGLQGQFTLNVTTHYRYDCVIDGQWTRTPLARSWVNVDGVPSTEKTKLETTGNWTAKEYIGTAITGTFQGQRHYDSDYLFLAVSDNIWIRTARA